MNRTIIGLKRANTLSNVASIGASEEQLGAAIFHCLTVLSKRHSPSEQFRAVFDKVMFQKPNTKAFIHVLHFLFTVYDPKEFRKRFYWPIFDKNAESAFRSSTVEYVNGLIERGKLDGEKIKAHLVVLPGGLKFMKFLLTLIRFVMKEELRRSGGGTGRIVTKKDIVRIAQYHAEWEDIGAKMREIVQKDLGLIQGRIHEVDEVLEEMLATCQGPVKQMSFEKLVQLWGTFNRKRFEENEARRGKFREVTEEYNKMMATAKKKLEPKELVLGVNEDELKETLYRLEGAFPDNACNFREVFDETGKIDAVKLFEIIIFLLPDVNQHLSNFSVRSVESLKFEMKELSKVAVKSDSLCHELASLRRSLPFVDAKFQELNNRPELDELNNDLGIRNKIFNTPPITLNFQENSSEAATQTIAKRNRLALLDDDHVHQMNLRMRLLSSSICHQLPKTPRSAKKQKLAQASPGAGVFAVPKPARKEKMNPLSMLNKITAQGKSKPKPPQVQLPVNSTMNISSLSTLGDISLRPEFSSTLLGTPEKQQSVPIPTVEPAPPPPPTTFHPSPRFKHFYPPEGSSATTTNQPTGTGTMSPDSLLILSQNVTGPTTKRRSSLLQVDQLQTSPSGKLEPLPSMMAKSKATAAAYRISLGGCTIPEIRISLPPSPQPLQQQKQQLGEMDSCWFDNGDDHPAGGETILAATRGQPAAVMGRNEPVGDDLDQEDLERTLHHENNSSALDLSTTLVDLGMSQLSLTCQAPANGSSNTGDAQTPLSAPKNRTRPRLTMVDEDLFNVSDGILTDFD